MSINIYNTEIGAKEPLETLEKGLVKMYVCGPTPYSSAHLGHARVAVTFDVIRRYLEYRGYAVLYISNLTDIDDKIINRAAKEGVTEQAISLKYIEEYFEDTAALGVLPPTIMPRATQHIPDMIAVIEDLVNKGNAYAVDGSVYFSVESFPNYGRLSKRKIDDDDAKARVSTDERKRHPADFALWKSVKEGEPFWSSPWGDGRPGWHIECSAMAMRYCSGRLDIHGGGADLVFPHHENEIAQSEAHTGKRFVRHWMHNGFINLDGRKMAKSEGNFFLLREALKNNDPSTLRWFLLGTHYRTPVDFTPERLDEAASAMDRVYTARERIAQASATGAGEDAGAESLSKAASDAIGRFVESMNDDFNTARALAVIFELVGSIFDALATSKNPDSATLEALKKADDALCEILQTLGIPRERSIVGGSSDSEELVNLLLSLRSTARDNKNFETADAVRDGLKVIGFEIEDLAGGKSIAVQK